MLIDYTKAELTQLDNLKKQLKPALDKAFETLCKAQDDFAKLDTDAQQGKRPLSNDEAKIAAEIEKTQNEYWAVMAKYEHERSAITHKAEARELRYFTAHTDKLAERLQFEIEAQIVSFGMLQNHSDFQAVFQNDTEIKKRLTATLEQYFDILKKHDIETYQLVIDFMEKAITDKEELTQAYREKIEGTSAENSNSSKAKSAQRIEKAVAIRATEFFAPVDKVSQTLADRRKNHTFYENPEVIIRVGKKGGKPVNTLVSVKIDDLQGVTLGNDAMLNPYNRTIHNIAVSLYTAGNTHFTPRMIYEAMNGYQREHKPPEQVCKAITDSMRKLMYTAIKIDATEEAKAFGVDKLKFEGHLLPVVLTTAEINGQEIECFKFVDEPPLYTYASKKKQISRCDIKLLAVDLSMTPENVVIRDYLLEQITSMQSKKSKLLNVIRYDTLYEYLGIDAPNENALRQRKNDIRAKVRTILNTWVREHFIARYEEERERSTVAKVRIFITDNT